MEPTQNANTPQAEPIPQGFSVQAEAIPQGFTVDGGSQPQPQSQGKPQDTGQSFGDAVADNAKNVAIGFGKGALDTVHGISSMIHAGGEFIHAGLGERLAPQSGVEAMDKMSTPDGMAQKIGYGGESLMEFLLGDEALKGLSMADKLAKSAQIAKLLENSPRVMKALQMGADIGKVTGQLSPEAVEVLKANPILARLAATGMDAIRQGAVQGTQTTVKSGGDVKKGVKEGATMGVTSGVLGTPFAVAGGMLDKAGQAAATVKKMNDIAANAPAKSEVSDLAGTMVGKAEKAMHTNFENGINTIKDSLSDQAIDLKGSPLQKAAEDIIGAKEGTHPLDKLAGDTAPVSDNARTYIKGIAESLEKKAPEAAGTAVQREPGIIDALGRDTGGEIKEAADEPVKINIDNLIKARQTLGERMRGLGWDSAADRADREAYSKMIDGVDDTIEKLTGQSSKIPKDSELYQQAAQELYPNKAVADLSTSEIRNSLQKAQEMKQEALQDNPGALYKEIRNKYRETKKLFDDPEIRTAIRNINNGNLDDVGKELTTGTKAGYKIETLSKIVGKNNMNKISDHVFQTWVDDASKEFSQSGDITSTRFNPDKLIKKWASLKPEIREKLFQLTPARKEAYNQLMSQVGDVSSVKKLIKYGMLPASFGAAGVVAGPFATMIAAMAGLGIEGSFGKVRDILDNVANSPKMWSTLGSAAGKSAALEGSKAASMALTSAKVATAKGADKVTEGAKSYAKNDSAVKVARKVISGTSSALGGTAPAPDKLPDPKTFK